MGSKMLGKIRKNRFVAGPALRAEVTMEAASLKAKAKEKSKAGVPKCAEEEEGG